MKLNTLLSSVFVLASLAASARAGNVLLIVGDDIGIDQVTSLPSSTLTPNLYAKANAGVRFTRVWSNPLCSPTRATIQTGRYSFRTGVGTVVPTAPTLPVSEFTIAEALTSASSGAIESGAFGKWHLSSTASAFGRMHPLTQGYATFQGVIAGAVSDYYSWPKSVDGGASTTCTTYATTENATNAKTWIAAQETAGVDWFCYLAFNAAHQPRHVPPTGTYTTSLTGLDLCTDATSYSSAMIEALDYELGVLFATLPSDTTIIFVGDNGSDTSCVGADGPLHSKGTLYEGGIHVPMFISGAGVSATGNCAALVNTSDLFATVIALFGYTASSLVPATTTLDSTSLVPYLALPGRASLRTYAYSELYRPSDVWGTSTSAIVATTDDCGVGGQLTYGEAVRTTRFKLIRFVDGSEEFYDLLLDATETDDLLLHSSLTTPQQTKYDELSAFLDANGI